MKVRICLEVETDDPSIELDEATWKECLEGSILSGEDKVLDVYVQVHNGRKWRDPNASDMLIRD